MCSCSTGNRAARLAIFSFLPAVCFVFGAGIEATFGQTFWTAGIGDWNTASNWTLGVPDSASGTAFDAVIENGGTPQLSAAGASVRRLRVGRVGGPGHLVIDGGGLTVTDNLHLNEGSGGAASVIVQGGSTVTAPTTVVGFSSNFPTSFQISGAGTVYNATTLFDVGRTGAGSASLTVDSGAVLASATSTIAAVNGAPGSATVTGAGSRWSSTGAFTVGSGAAGVLNITNQGTVHVGTALTISNTSNINLNGGTLRFNTISGHIRLNYTAGTIQLAGNRDSVLDGNIFDFYGLPRIIPSGKGLTVEGTTTFRQNSKLTVSGGTFTSQGLLTLGVPGQASGALLINSGGTAFAGADVRLDNFGWASIDGAGSTWTVGGNFQVSPTGGRGDLSVNDQGNLYIGGTLSLGSSGFLFLNGGTIRFNGYSRTGTGAVTYSAGTVQLAGNRTLGSDAATIDFFGASPNISTGKALVVEGTATLTSSAPLTLSGGAFSASTVLMSPGSRMTNTLPVQVSGAMLGLAGSVIDATAANLTLGDSNKVNGFYANGTIQIGERTVTLADANDAVLDSAALVELGGDGTSGSLVAANGLTLNFGGNITGQGTIDTPNHPAKPFINNGNLTGESLAAPLTLPGYVKGVGNYDNVDFTGTFSPGFSPAKVNLGSAQYGGTLHIEIGGLNPGSGHDQLNHILGDGLANLGGTLEVSLINGFVPQANDSFTILTAVGGITGVFATEELPELASGLSWNVAYDANAVMLQVVPSGMPGDQNSDGVLDARDYVLWRKNYGPQSEYESWRAGFGQPSGGGNVAASGSAVPEPTSAAALLMLFACGAVRIRCSACRQQQRHTRRGRESRGR